MEIILAILGIISTVVSGIFAIVRLRQIRKREAEARESELKRKREEWTIEQERSDEKRQQAFDDALMKQTERAQSMLEDAFKRITQLDKERTQAVQDATLHMEKRTQAETQVSEKQSIIETQMKMLDEARESLLDAMRKVGMLEGAQGELKEQVESLQIAHTHIQKEFSKLIDQKRDLEAKNITLEQERSRLQVEITALREQVTQLGKQYEQLAEDYAKLAKDYEELKQRYEQDKIHDNRNAHPVLAGDPSGMGTIPPHTDHAG